MTKQRQVTFRFLDGTEVKFDVNEVYIDAARRGSEASRCLIEQAARKVRSVQKKIIEKGKEKRIKCPMPYCHARPQKKAFAWHMETHREALQKMVEGA